MLVKFGHVRLPVWHPHITYTHPSSCPMPSVMKQGSAKPVYEKVRWQSSPYVALYVTLYIYIVYTRGWWNACRATCPCHLPHRQAPHRPWTRLRASRSWGGTQHNVIVVQKEKWQATPDELLDQKNTIVRRGCAGSNSPQCRSHCLLPWPRHTTAHDT